MKFAKLLAFVLLSALPLHAQVSDEEGSQRFWQLSLPDEGNFMVALDRIASVSRSSYILDGNLAVTEVTIDTVGNALCRIYHLAPIAAKGASSSLATLTKRADELAQRGGELSGLDPNAVHKSYPNTTHAKTVEYRIKDLESLEALYASLTRAWSNGRGRTFTVE